MPPDPEHEEDRLALLERLKQASTTSSLTLLSIVQGVALADLAGVVQGGAQGAERRITALGSSQTDGECKSGVG